MFTRSETAIIILAFDGSKTHFLVNFLLVCYLELFNTRTFKFRHHSYSFVSPILLLSWISNMVTLQLGQLKHSDSYLRGQQQRFMGALFVHWARIWIKVELSEMVSSPEGCRAQGNTPDFMFEHFIGHPSDDTRWTPPIGRWSLTVISIQLCTLKAKYNRKTLQ